MNFFLRIMGSFDFKWFLSQELIMKIQWNLHDIFLKWWLILSIQENSWLPIKERSKMIFTWHQMMFNELHFTLNEFIWPQMISFSRSYFDNSMILASIWSLYAWRKFVWLEICNVQWVFFNIKWIHLTSNNSFLNYWFVLSIQGNGWVPI